MIVRTESQGAQSNVQMLVHFYDRLELAFIDAFLRSDDSQALFVFLVLRYRTLDGCVVFLVARQDVCDQR